MIQKDAPDRGIEGRQGPLEREAEALSGQKAPVDVILLEAALAYVRKAWPALPVHTPAQGKCSCLKVECPHPGKHPRTRHGLKDATTDESVIRRWWEMWPSANIAVATGNESGLVVLDIDPRHGGDENLHALEAAHGTLPETITALTGGGGLHKLFAHPGGRVKCCTGKDALLPGVEVKGDGGYIIVEPSLHVSGRAYAWEIGCGPGEIPMALLPTWLLGLIVQKAVRSKGVPAARIDERISEGSRNATLASFAGTMRRRGMSQSAILAALLEENAQRCDPPLEEEEVQGIVKSIARYAPGMAVSRHPASTEEPAVAYRQGLRVHRVTGPVPRPRSLRVDKGARWPS